MSTIFVTGANGFIAQHTVVQLLNKGYKVIGSVRSASKGQVLKDLLKNDKFSFVVIPNMGEVGSFDSVLQENQDVTGILHIASPFKFNVESPEKDILIPAIEGVKTLYDSIVKYAPQVTRVVYTSSDAAARFDLDSPETTIDENVWSPLTYEESKNDKVQAYLASKPIAERYAWNFIKNNRVNFEMVSVLPSNTLGPQAFDEFVVKTLNTSCQAIDEVVNLNPDSQDMNHRYGGWIDVRDAATAHIVALEKKEAVDHRLVLVSSVFTSQTVYDIVNEVYPKQNFYKGTPGTDVEEIKKITKMDYHVTRDILGFKYRTLKETLVDSIDQILKVRGTKL